MKCIYIKGVKVSICDLETASSEALRLSRLGSPYYICVTDAGNIVNAYRHSRELRTAINDSAISLPDGRPISMLANAKGIAGMGRVAGPDFMEKMFRLTAGSGSGHFFIGDTEQTLKRLSDLVRKQFNAEVAGYISPPFGESSGKIDEEIMRSVNSSGAEFVWVGLGGGKQEIWMHRNIGHLDKGIMTGVGAAFRFMLGDIKRAPKPMQGAGLEWLFRLFQQPGKMGKRYASTLPLFAVYSIQELLTNKMKSE